MTYSRHNLIMGQECERRKYEGWEKSGWENEDWEYK
jgi:hypothetical protein